jgi:glycine oxidase
MTKQVDYIIVGLGIGGICMAQTLLDNNKSVMVINNREAGATSSSGGVLNPTVLKRFTAAWNASQFFEVATSFYKNLQEKLKEDVIRDISIFRIFKSTEEQNDWMVASTKLQLEKFLSNQITLNTNPSIKASFGLGEVLTGSILDPKELVIWYGQYLRKEDSILDGAFEHDQLILSNDHCQYKHISAKRIIFCEGAKVENNPFFKISISPNNDKVFVGNKGEYVIIKAPQLKCEHILKGSAMLIPLGNDCYKVGATYGRDDFSDTVTKEATLKIVEQIKSMISCPFEVVGQVTGVRPTVKDRKPLVGVSKEHSQIAFLNGLGTRGLSMAPLLAQQLCQHLENGIALPSEINIQRFWNQT